MLHSVFPGPGLDVVDVKLDKLDLVILCSHSKLVIHSQNSFASRVGLTSWGEDILTI